MNKCNFCEKKLSNYKAKRCRDCYNKYLLKNGKNTNRYIDGRTLKKYHCIDCEKEVSYDAKRCHSCATKERFKDSKNHPNFGKHYTEESKLKMSKAHLGKKLSNRTKEKMSKAHKGKKKSIQHCRNISKAFKGRKVTWGKKISITRKKLKYIGTKAGNYIHGLSYLPYTSKFNEELKEQIRKRDNYTCQYCGMTQEECLKKYNRKLDVHHIDYDKLNCNEENLTSLCQACHLKTNGNRDYYYAYFTYIMESLNA